MSNYRILRRVAIGPVAEVFLGTTVLAEGIESPVAVKRLLPNRAADPRAVRRFAHRAAQVLRVSDPSLVQLLEAGTDGDGHFLVIEWVDGAALGAVQTGAAFRSVRLGPGEATYVAERLAVGLATLHEARAPGGRPMALLHRNLNPAAVLISRRGEVRLSGLVTGRLAAIEGLDPHRRDRGYLAPEAIARRPVGPASDLFSLGVILWELLAGGRLFGAGDAAARIAAFDPAQLPALPDVPPALLDLVRRLLARDPAARFPSARATAAAIRDFRAGTRLTSAAPELAALLARALPVLPAGRGAPDEFAGELALRPYPPRLRPGRDETPPPRPAPRRRRLGEILVERGRVRPVEIEEALEVQKIRGGKLGEILRERGVVSEMDLVRAASLQAGLPFVSDEKLDAMPVPRELVSRLPPAAAEHLRVVPLTFREKTLYVATLDPRDEKLLADVQRIAGVPAVKGVFATSAALERALIRFYRSVGLPDPSRAALSITLRLLGASTPGLGGAAELGPALAELSRRLTRELGGSRAEGDAAAAGGFALALAARGQGQVRFARPDRGALEAVLGPDLGDAAPLLLAALREAPPLGAAAEALSAAAGFVEAAGSSTPPPDAADRALAVLREESGASPRAIAALTRILDEAAT